MNAFLAAEDVELHRIVHGEQRFAYERPIVAGDVLRATLTVVSLRQIGGNAIIGTRREITDADGKLVCATSATLVHRAAAEVPACARPAPEPRPAPTPPPTPRPTVPRLRAPPGTSNPT